LFTVCATIRKHHRDPEIPVIPSEDNQNKTCHPERSEAKSNAVEGPCVPLVNPNRAKHMLSAVQPQTTPTAKKSKLVILSAAKDLLLACSAPHASHAPVPFVVDPCFNQQSKIINQQ
jgi:hypothetical protein